MKKIDLDKLAKTLGVSKTLVSLVLNGKGDRYGISKKTQNEVLKKAQEMNYKPNLIARGLRTGKSNIIGLIVSDISNPFYAKISRSIEDSASKNGYNLIICSSEEDENKEKELIELLVRGQNADGIIVSSTQQKAVFFNELQAAGKSIVLIDRTIPLYEGNYVTVNNYGGAFELTEHLIKNGHRKIAMLTISPQFISSITQRVEGYKDALKKHGIVFNKNYLKEIPFNDISGSVNRDLKALLKGKQAVDALFVANNNLAVSCFETINNMRLKIPADIALTSFDDLDMFKFSDPPITAVAQPVQEIGEKAFGIVLNLMQNKSGKKQGKSKEIKLAVELKIRKSCGNRAKMVKS